VLNKLLYKTRKPEKANRYRKTSLDIGSRLGTKTKLVGLEGKCGYCQDKQRIDFVFILKATSLIV